MTLDILSFFKQFKSNHSVGRRFEKILDSLPFVTIDRPYYQQTVEFIKVQEWESALDSLIELVALENVNIPNRFWTEMWLIAANIDSSAMRKICCKEVGLELKRSRKVGKWNISFYNPTE